MGMFAKIRRMLFRDRMSIRKVARHTELSGYTIQDRLRRGDVVEPIFNKCPSYGRCWPTDETAMHDYMPAPVAA